MAKTKGKKMVTIELDPNLVDRLDKLAINCGISRHQLMKNFIESCTAEGEFLSKVGVIYTVKKMKAFLDLGKTAFEEEARQEKLSL